MTARLPAPRWQTPLPAGVVGSWGPEAAAWGEATLGIRLDRWQRRALNRALAVDAAGRLVHRLYLVSVARQNGKTALVRVLVGWMLAARYTPAWTRALGLAHDRTQARIPYEAVLADLAPLAARLGAAGRGGLSLTRYLGIRSAMFGRPREYHVASREARNAVRSMSVDLALFDEVRTQVNRDTWAALEPTTTARPDPLIFAISTAGSDRSILLRDWFDMGRRIIDGTEPAGGFGMTWYAPPDDMAHDDPRALRYANPALAEGRLQLAGVIGTGTIRPGTPEWMQERLNLWTDSADEWLPVGTWRRQTGEQPEGYVRVVLGAEAVPTWRRATVTVALVTDAGVYVAVAGELDASRSVAGAVSPAQLVALLDTLAGQWRPSLVTYSASAAAAPHVAAWAESGRFAAHGLTPRDIRSASALFRSELIGGRLTHADDALLGTQARQARPSSAIEGGDWYFSIRDSLGEIDGIRAAAWAAWGAIAPEAAAIAPQLFV